MKKLFKNIYNYFRRTKNLKQNNHVLEILPLDESFINDFKNPSDEQLLKAMNINPECFHYIGQFLRDDIIARKVIIKFLEYPKNKHKYPKSYDLVKDQFTKLQRKEKLEKLLS